MTVVRTVVNDPGVHLPHERVLLDAGVLLHTERLEDVLEVFGHGAGLCQGHDELRQAEAGLSVVGGQNLEVEGLETSSDVFKN